MNDWPLDDAATATPVPDPAASGRHAGRGEAPPPKRADAASASPAAVDPPEWGRVQAALPYVVAVARPYARSGVPLDELVAAGNLGLVEAALRFDPARNVRFVTYADWWIRKAILTAISDQIGPVRVPRYRQDQLRALGDARRRLRARHGREPSIEATAREAGLEPEDLALLLGLGQRVVALDHPQHDDLGRPMAERLSYDENGGAQRALLDRDRRVRLRDLVSGLERRLREVVVLRFGLGGDPPATLREVGGRLGVSRERVRQIETRALALLRRALQER